MKMNFSFKTSVWDTFLLFSFKIWDRGQGDEDKTSVRRTGSLDAQKNSYDT